jgi:hypothetical protein
VPLLAFGLILFAILATIALLPLSIIQRYRMGTSRQRARSWLITINLFGLTVSTLMFLIGAAVTSIWVPQAFLYTVAGLMGGCALGVLGLMLTRWEDTAGSIHYTPSRLLVLGITLVVTARLLYGLARAWNGWRGAVEGTGWLAASGAAGSLAAGAVVLGYYVVYWAGVRRRLRRRRKQQP